MQNMDLTRWLEMVWDALDEQDELKRDHLLNAADMFLQSDTQETESTPSSTARIQPRSSPPLPRPDPERRIVIPWRTVSGIEHFIRSSL